MMYRIAILLSALFFATTLNAQEIITISPVQAKSMIDTLVGKHTIIIDARDSTMFANAHIKGAVNIDAFKEDASNLILPYLNASSIIIYCTHTKRSDQLAETFIQSGFKGTVFKISDGITGWKSCNYFVE